MSFKHRNNPRFYCIQSFSQMKMPLNPLSPINVLSRPGCPPCGLDHSAGQHHADGTVNAAPASGGVKFDGPDYALLSLFFISNTRLRRRLGLESWCCFCLCM